MRKSSFNSNIWKMNLMRFLRGLHFFGGVLIPFFTEWANLSYAQILLLQSWFMVWIFILEVPTGAIADYFGRKVSVALASFSAVAGALVYISVPNFYVFLAGEFLFALGAALLSGADQALIYDSLKRAGRSKASKSVFGRYRSMGLIGILIASPIGGVMGSLDLRLPMLSFALPAFLAGLVALTMKEPHTRKKTESVRYLNILTEGVKYLSKHRILKILAIDMAFVGTIVYFILWFFQIMLKNAGVGIEYFGFVHATFTIGEIIILTNFSKLENFLGSKRRLLLLSTILPGIMFVIGGLTTYLPLVLLSILLIGSLGLSRDVLLQNYMNKYIPTPKRATILSASNMLKTFSIAAVNPFVGLLADFDFNATLIILGLAAIAWGLMSEMQETMLKD